MTTHLHLLQSLQKHGTVPQVSYKYLRHDNQDIENVQTDITPSSFSFRKECLKPAAVSKSQGLLVLDVNVITDFIFTPSRVFLNGSL